jgi:hypothetical protein
MWYVVVVYAVDVYLEVHDPDHLEEASSTITRPTGGYPPVTQTFFRKLKESLEDNFSALRWAVNPTLARN